MTILQPEFETEPLLTPREVDGTGLRVFPVAFDACVLGWVTGPGHAREILGWFHDFGGNMVSTADHYAGGRSELMLGDWLRTVDRGRIVVATKVGRHPDSPGLTRRAILASVEASLERLGTDYIDLLSFDGDLLGDDPSEALVTIEELIGAGKVRFLSAAHFGGPRLAELTDFAVSAGLPVFRAALVEYNLMARTVFEREFAPLAAERGLGLIARLPLASGFLTGEIRSKTDLPANPMFDGALAHVGRRGFKVLDAVQEIAAEIGTSPASVALSWLLSRPGVTAAAVRINDLDMLHRALEGAGAKLTRHQLVRLDAASA